jgi:hypothetical protein
MKPSPEKVGVFYLPQMLVTLVQGEFSLALKFKKSIKKFGLYEI